MIYFSYDLNFFKTLFQYYGNIMNEISAAEENRSMLSMIFFA